jgi:hypothetical protein
MYTVLFTDKIINLMIINVIYIVDEKKCVEDDESACKRKRQKCSENSEFAVDGCRKNFRKLGLLMPILFSKTGTN